MSINVQVTQPENVGLTIETGSSINVAIRGLHNALAGLQGGSNTERFHLTQSEVNLIHQNSTDIDIISGLLPSNTLTNIVFQTGNQDISGLKDFQTRPTVVDIPVLLSGEPVDLIHLYGKNDQGSNLYKGQPVYIHSANGNNPLIQIAANTGERTSSKTIGLLAQDLPINEFGYIVTEGILEGFDTSSGAHGDPMWLGPSGNIIYGFANKPYGNNHLVYLGIVLRSNKNNGKAYVKVQNGFEIDELHQVYAKNPSNKDTLVYNSSSGSWFSRQLNTGDISEINNYLLKSSTGDFYPASNPSGFITGVDLSPYVTGDVVRPSQTGAFYPASNPSGFLTGISNIVYTTGDQSIAGNKTFSDNIVGNGTSNRLPNQQYIDSSSVITANTLITLLERSSLGIYGAAVSNGGAFTQFVNLGNLGFTAGTIAGATAMRLNYNFIKSLLLNDTTYNIAGGGYMMSFSLSHKCCFGFYLSSDTTARDVEIRFAYGNTTANATPNTSVASPNNAARLGTMGNSVGWGIKLTKHPVNNTYLCRLYTRSFDWNSNINISNISNTSPMVVTTPSAHNLTTGDTIEITGVAGITAANGEWIVTVLSPTTFSLDGSVGNGLLITNATNANPIVITTASAHGLSTGNSITIQGVCGNTNANGTRTITVISPTTFSLNGIVGNAAFSNSYAFCKMTSSSIEFSPRKNYNAAFVWDAVSKTVSFHLNDPSSAALLSLFTFSSATNYSMGSQLGNLFHVGLASVTYTGGVGLQASSPTLYLY